MIIVVQPADATVAVGTTATFTVVATAGGLTISYRWQINTGAGWVDIPGANNASYTTPPTTFADDGNQYQVIVSDMWESLTSRAALLMVVSAPIIIKQPEDTTVLIGTQATFEVTATGTGTLSYQWQYSTDGTWQNIPGAVYRIYTTPPTMLRDNGTRFRVIVSNAYGTVTSNFAILILLLPSADTYLITNIGWHNYTFYVEAYDLDDPSNLSPIFPGSGNITLKPGQSIEVEQDRVNRGQIEFLAADRHGARAPGRILKVIELHREEPGTGSSDRS